MSLKCLKKIKVVEEVKNLEMRNDKGKQISWVFQQHTWDRG